MRKLLFVALIAIPLLAPQNTWADVSEATFTPQGRVTYPPVSEGQVEIFILKPDFKFRVIGVIEARGMAEGSVSIFDQLDIISQLFGDRPAQPGEKEDIALAMRALRTEAAKNGAQGVIIIKSVQSPVGQGATERRIVAAAIRPE